MKIYISGSYSEQTRLRARAATLTKQGYAITSTWLQEVHRPSHLTEEEWEYALALKDLVDLSAADCIICDLDGVSTTGGRYVEWGFAIGRFNLLKLVVTSGKPTVFSRLADRRFKDWDGVYTYLREEHSSGAKQE